MPGDLRPVTGRKILDNFRNGSMGETSVAKDQYMPFFLRRTKFVSGKEIFVEGDAADSAYIVESGCVAISKEVDGQDLVLGTIGLECIFGEMALIDNQPRMATATAIEDTVCVVLPARVFHKQMQRLEPFMRMVVLGLIANLRNTPLFVMKSLEAMARADVYEGTVDEAEAVRQAVRRLAEKM